MKNEKMISPPFWQLLKAILKPFFMAFILFNFALTSAVANPEEYKLATWNLQGSAAVTESKWNISVRQIVSGDNAADILMIQEAGSLPTTATPTGRTFSQGGIVVTEYSWQLGSLSRPHEIFIYFSQTDLGANRVNLAIVSRFMATNVVILPPPTTASRPIIGIELGNDAFFNTHALANGGTDAPAIINAVYAHYLNNPEITWMIMGDFNRDPEDLRTALRLEPRVRVSFLSPNAPTQRSGGTLDYGVVGNSSGDLVQTALVAILMLANLRTHITSDHFPVNFRRLGDN